MSHSEQRNNDLTKLDIENDSFPHKKGRGNNPNSRKNLKPFKKGQSGNPSGKPVKFAQLKEVLDEYGDKGEFDASVVVVCISIIVSQSDIRNFIAYAFRYEFRAVKTGNAVPAIGPHMDTLDDAQSELQLGC